MDKEVTLFDESKGAVVASTPADLLRIAVSQNADLDKLEKLMELQERWENREAKKLFVKAMTGFRNDCPQIFKTQAVDFKNKAGARTNYNYAGLPDTIEKIKGVLKKYELSHTWKTSQDGNLITVSCCVCHIAGHEECTSLTAQPDTTGNKNAVQAIASTVTYLERYTLFAILGLASAEDTDGGSPVETITSEQACDLKAVLEETNSVKSFLTAYEIENVDDLPAGRYSKAMKSAEAKRKK